MIYAVAQVVDPYGVLGQSHQQELKIGTFVNAEIQGLPADDVVVLPRYVLRADNTILTANADNKLEILPVTVLRAEPMKVYLSKGIAGGTRVVITTLDAPVPGTRLAIRGQEDSNRARDQRRERTMNSNQGWYAAIIDWFARNAVAANLLMLILLLGGLYSVFTIKKESQPPIETNFITVTMPFLGSSPEDVEEGILVKIEESIQDIEGIQEIMSTGRRGSGEVQVEVRAGYDVPEVMNEIKNRVDSISTFPDNTEKPIVSRTRFQQQVTLVSVYGDVDERTLKEYAKQVRNEIVTLPGITRAELLGSRPYEISIEVSEFTLERYGMSLAEIAQAVRRGSLDLPAGSIRSDAGDIQLRTKGQAYTGLEFEDILVRTNADGSRVLLKDVANIRDDFEETGRFSEFNGKPAFTIQVLSVGDQNELDISQTVRDYVAEKQTSIPSGVALAAWADVTYYLKSRLDMMIKNLVIGALLVFLSLALFLRLKLAFWVMVGLPVAFLGTFFLMPLFGITVNLISLFGFILVLGIIVDDAIVIGESAYTNMRAKGHSIDNILEGVHKVAMPATFGVLTTMAAFIPILMISGIMGKFFASIGWVVTLCLVFSLIESKLILPAAPGPYEGQTLRRRNAEPVRSLSAILQRRSAYFRR